MPGYGFGRMLLMLDGRVIRGQNTGRCHLCAEREATDGLDDLVQRVDEAELDAVAIDHRPDLADPLAGHSYVGNVGSLWSERGPFILDRGRPVAKQGSI